VSYAALIVSVTVYHRDAASGVRVRRRRGEAAPAFPVRLLQRRGEGLLVADLRVVLDGEQGQPTLRWATTRERLLPGRDDGFAYPVPFSVLGRSTGEVIAEFEPSGALDWSPASDEAQPLRLQGADSPERRLGRSRRVRLVAARGGDARRPHRVSQRAWCRADVS
jgi:hypothetical protein